MADHRIGVLGGRLHGDHPGDLLAHGRVEKTLEQLRLETRGHHFVENKTRSSTRTAAAQCAAQVRQATDEVRPPVPRPPDQRRLLLGRQRVGPADHHGLRSVTDFASYHYHGDVTGLAAFRERMTARPAPQRSGFSPLRLG